MKHTTTEMKTRGYSESEYRNIINFLGKIYQLDKSNPYWIPARWEYAEYLVGPLHQKRGLADWKNSIGIWENAGKIIAIANSEYPDENYFLHVHPDYKNVEKDVIDWVEKSVEEPVIWALENDRARVELLEFLGYKMQEKVDYLNWCELGEFEQKQDFAKGYIFASLKKRPKLRKSRIECTALAFGSEKVADEIYDNFENAKFYRSSLDLCIVAPGDEVVAICTIWLDKDNSYGYFEPVGVHPEYQNMGLGKALMNYGLSVLKETGVEKAFVGASDDGKKYFYYSSGFEKRVKAIGWKKTKQ